ncbi:ATP phosphoribosyltransferase [Candidatus Bilamarchaeum dharawalense]|uniref:ATP phosphoribosyltransferase n=1 Tax=Candidatus Bilamarchaeum dharawalense TaxID=2885759 RepID=A0A5E4LVK4_9ARCH|nr:ATP phosphoribosyltransferase [Candidatus Bilamarchaeum dharawalense]
MIKLAIPNKGRLNPEIIKLLEKIGLTIPENGRKLYANSSNPNIQILYARAADIPLYVQSGAADLGISGEDMISESEADVKILLKLNFGQCRIVVAAPSTSKIKSPENYTNGIRVATRLVNISRKYFNTRKISCKIVPVSGATELAPYLGIADIIIDQVSTGTTLAQNNLVVIDNLLESRPCLMANKKSLIEKEDEIANLTISIESVLTAEAKRYIMANVPNKRTLDSVVKVMPAMDSPTILSLANGAYSIHSVVDSADLISAIGKIKKAGAKDILVMNVSRVVE